jgi:hypothetical protein
MKSINDIVAQTLRIAGATENLNISAKDYVKAENRLTRAQLKGTKYIKNILNYLGYENITNISKQMTKDEAFFAKRKKVDRKIYIGQ